MAYSCNCGHTPTAECVTCDVFKNNADVRAAVAAMDVATKFNFTLNNEEGSKEEQMDTNNNVTVENMKTSTKEKFRELFRTGKRTMEELGDSVSDNWNTLKDNLSNITGILVAYGHEDMAEALATHVCNLDTHMGIKGIKETRDAINSLFTDAIELCESVNPESDTWEDVVFFKKVVGTEDGQKEERHGLLHVMFAACIYAVKWLAKKVINGYNTLVTKLEGTIFGTILKAVSDFFRGIFDIAANAVVIVVKITLSVISTALALVLAIGQNIVKAIHDFFCNIGKKINQKACYVTITPDDTITVEAAVDAVEEC